MFYLVNLYYSILYNIVLIDSKFFFLQISLVFLLKVKLKKKEIILITINKLF